LNSKTKIKIKSTNKNCFLELKMPLAHLPRPINKIQM
jgi:hypothetical protein